MARERPAQLEQRAGLRLKQTYGCEGKRLRRVLKRQRTVLGRLLRDIERKLSGASDDRQAQLRVWLERAWRIFRQRPKDKNKLYALHTPEVECIGKGKARQPYEFGVKVSLAITDKQGLIVGARRRASSKLNFPGPTIDSKGICYFTMLSLDTSPASYITRPSSAVFPV
jgi:transposase, IS5 family